MYIELLFCSFVAGFEVSLSVYKRRQRHSAATCSCPPSAPLHPSVEAAPVLLTATSPHREASELHNQNESCTTTSPSTPCQPCLPVPSSEHEEQQANSMDGLQGSPPQDGDLLATVGQQRCERCGGTRPPALSMASSSTVTSPIACSMLANCGTVDGDYFIQPDSPVAVCGDFRLKIKARVGVLTKVGSRWNRFCFELRQVCVFCLVTLRPRLGSSGGFKTYQISRRKSADGSHWK